MSSIPRHSKSEYGVRAGVFGCSTLLFIGLMFGAIATGLDATRTVDTSKLPAGMLECEALPRTIDVASERWHQGYFATADKLPNSITIQFPRITAINAMRHTVAERLVVAGKVVREIKDNAEPPWGKTLRAIGDDGEVLSSLRVECERDIPVERRALHSWIDIEGYVHFVSPRALYPGSKSFVNADHKHSIKTRILFVSDEESIVARNAKGAAHAKGMANGPWIAAFVTFLIGSLSFACAAISIRKYLREV